MLPKEPGLEMDFTLESERSGIVDEPAFQLLMLGDWSSDQARGDWGHRRPIEVDRDNFDDVMRSLDIRLEIDCDGVAVNVALDSMDSFHPDELFKTLPVFSDLRGLRKRLRDPQTFNSAAREIRSSSGVPIEATREEAATPRPETPASGSLLDSILANPEGGESAAKAPVSGDLARLVEHVVRPHLIGVDEDEQASLIGGVDMGIAAVMRSILHDRKFKDLEAAWRGLYFLVRRTETASDLRIFIFDATKAEVAEDVKDPERSSVKSTLLKGANGDPWAAFFGNYGYAADVDDIAAIIRIGKIAASAKTPFISHIRPEILGVDSLSDRPDPDEWDLSGESSGGKLWSAVRELPESKFVGMTMPRFLSRLPYGSATEPTEAFSFEEFVDPGDTSNLLWSNGCFVAAQLLGASYSQFGWQFGEQYVQDVDGLPMYVIRSGGETIQQPSAEVQLSQNSAEKLMEYGVMPLVSFKDSDRVRLLRLQSITDPVSRLAARWG
ncbi:MAG: type VI secretion system contractile sheath large subunit [Chloracidobacterium sp.]|nr:type VI secretion system contractile sheath large subunit [Chloracidobacterium sp.]